MGTTIRGTRRAGACAATALGLASLWSVGAGAASTASPAVTLLRRSMTALGHVPTVVLSGYIPNGKQRMGILVRSVDHGREASGHVALGAPKGAAPQSFSYVVIGTTFYLHANEPFWAAQLHNPSSPALSKAVLKVLSGHWVRVPTSTAKSMEAGFGVLVDPAKLATGLLRGAMSQAMHLGPMTQVHGTAARTIVQGSSRMAVAAKGAPLPLKLVGPSASGGGVLTFAYPKHLHITAPKGALTEAQAGQEAAKQAG